MLISGGLFYSTTLAPPAQCAGLHVYKYQPITVAFTEPRQDAPFSRLHGTASAAAFGNVGLLPNRVLRVTRFACRYESMECAEPFSRLMPKAMAFVSINTNQLPFTEPCQEAAFSRLHGTASAASFGNVGLLFNRMLRVTRFACL